MIIRLLITRVNNTHVDGILLVFDGFRHDFGIEVIMETVVQMGFDGKWLEQEFLEEVALRGLTHENTFG